ncbi:MAG: serine/threonine protein kinase, partial [Verrucomicrobiales bacterium]|nr:serine/threonine protein kinase [Verrucomicrobiales bacterium]
MDAETRLLRRVFDEATEIASPADRSAFVAQACGGNDALRREVEELLGAHDRSDRVFDRFAPATRPSGAGDAAEEGERIGNYKLLQRIGEGGCGVVYMAEQEHPVRRRVALKVIKLGMDTAQVIARFEAERQALALMDHPNIARVLDAGATASGRPYFVMELVRGSKITEFCDQHSLDTPERLELFVRVCQGVQHAHQKGIIHRDLKPSNILVTLQDGVTPVPKIIDFGIAKATTDLRLTDKTLFTQFELLVGTPAYMSPEQAELNTADIDTRSDIYALGVLLYELLTGRTPFDGESLLKSGLDAMRRTIREIEPARPSTKMKTLAAADLTEVARRRRVEPLKLVSLLRGDLDWIVLKALEKDRRRRYETANALGMEVRRFLDHEPVAARPPSTLYSFQKLVRRNQAAFASVATVVVLLMVASVTSTSLAVRATRAQREQRRLRQVAEIAESEAERRTEENRERLVRMHVSSGNAMLRDGDPFAALPRFVEALQ